MTKQIAMGRKMLPLFTCRAHVHVFTLILNVARELHKVEIFFHLIILIMQSIFHSFNVQIRAYFHSFMSKSELIFSFYFNGFRCWFPRIVDLSTSISRNGSLNLNLRTRFLVLLINVFRKLLRGNLFRKFFPIWTRG